MIYNEKFIWLHFPKVAGTKIEEIFKKYYSEDRTICQDDIKKLRGNGTAPWHDSIKERITYDPSFEIKDKTIIVCIRKLNGWLKSRYNFEYKRTSKLPHDPNLLLQCKFYEATGFLNNADYYIENYLPYTLFKNNRVEFIRMENFESDFKRVFGKFIDINLIPNGEFQRKSNASTNYLSEDLSTKLKQTDLSLFSPKWSALERKIYGG